MLLTNNNIILFWIVILILFVIFSIIRLKYYANNSNSNPSPNPSPNTKISYMEIPLKLKINDDDQNTHKQEKFQNDTLFTNNPNPMNNPMNNPVNNYFNYNVSDYIKDLELTKVTDLPGCQNVFDDNIEVTRSLGYKDCHSALQDYVEKNLDTTKKYGTVKSLEEICPVTTNSNQYKLCMQKLFNKYTTNMNAMNKITGEIENNLNQRIQERNNVMVDLQNANDNFVRQNMLKDFLDQEQSQSKKAILTDQKLQNLYQFFNQRNKNLKNYENFTNPTTTNSNQYNPDDWIGGYNLIPGQFIILENFRMLFLDDILLFFNKDDQTEKIMYTTKIISNYKKNPNLLLLKIDKIKEYKNTENISNIMNLFQSLGLNENTTIFLSREPSDIVSSEYNYKLTDKNFDTIMYLEKLKF